MTSRRTGRGFLCLAAATAAATAVFLGSFGTSPSDAHACGNVYTDRVDPEIRALNAAQASLHHDEFAEAAKAILEQFPKARESSGATPESPLGRARRILALVAVRTGGAWYTAGQLRMPAQADAGANLAWAAAELERRLEANDTPGARTELGEAKARLSAQKQAGRALLEELAGKKMVTVAWGYVALARLRHEAKDAPGVEDALSECRRIAYDGDICKV